MCGLLGSSPQIFEAIKLAKFPSPISGGRQSCSKVRWSKESPLGMSGKGKIGGARVIYYFKKQGDEIWLLTIYSKSEIENIPAHVLRQIAKEIENV